MKKRHVVLIALVTLLLGFIIGSKVMSRIWRNQTVRLEYAMRATGRTNKISTLITAIDQLYVDSVDVDTLVEAVLPVLLNKLDPHSAYFPAEEAKESNDELHGSFSGIGVQFSMQDDTIHVNSVIRGGPSEKVGVLAGDRIVFIDDSLFAGKGVNSNDVVKRLKGPSGTEVKIGVVRPGDDGIIDFTIERGPIPVKSVDAAYMITDEIGYIELNKFGETTYSEMITGLAKLSSEGCRKIIIDLRGNTGGYLGTAIQIVNEFLPKGEMIVYTKGLHSEYDAEYANGRGRFQQIPMVIMIDESSASASEILTGAIQDNDRGTIVGRRSYGKGLVQQPIDFSDGSSIRLTIARYFTPSGRCIQKPYGKGDEDYAMDIIKRWEHGEFFSADSVHLDESQVFTTKSGRKVYGGGGIMPDVFVPQDTIAYNEYYSTIMRKSLTNKYSLKYVDSHRQDFTGRTTWKEVTAYLERQNVFSDFLKYAAGNGVERPKIVPAEAMEQLERVLYAGIIYDALDMQEYMAYINTFDSTVKKAVEILEEE